MTQFTGYSTWTVQSWSSTVGEQSATEGTLQDNEGIATKMQGMKGLGSFMSSTKNINPPMQAMLSHGPTCSNRKTQQTALQPHQLSYRV